MDEDSLPPEAVSLYKTALVKPLLRIEESVASIHGREWVLNHLPHRPPFVFIDSVQAIKDGVICARFDVDQHGTLFAAHFPGAPRWPGAVQLEAMAQAALTVYLFASGERRSEVSAAVVREARFMREVRPGSPVQLLGAYFEDGLFVTLVGQTLQSGRVCSACMISVV